MASACSDGVPLGGDGFQDAEARLLGGGEGDHFPGLALRACPALPSSVQRISTPSSMVRLLLSRAMQRKPRSAFTFMTTDEGEMSALKSGPG